jgi:hypothetical protein
METIPDDPTTILIKYSVYCKNGWVIYDHQIYEYAQILHKYMNNNDDILYCYCECYVKLVFNNLEYGKKYNDTWKYIFEIMYDILAYKEKYMVLFQMKYLMYILKDINIPSVNYDFICKILNNEKIYDYLLRDQYHNDNTQILNTKCNLLNLVNDEFYKKHKSEMSRIIDKIYYLITYKHTDIKYIHTDSIMDNYIDILSIIAVNNNYDNFIEYSINNRIEIPIECIYIYFCQKRYDVVSCIVGCAKPYVINEFYLELACLILDPNGIEFVFERVSTVSDECVQRCNWYFNGEIEFLNSYEKYNGCNSYNFNDKFIEKRNRAEKIMDKKISISQKYGEYKYRALLNYTKLKRERTLFTTCMKKIEEYDKIKENCVKLFDKYGYKLVNKKDYY